MHLFDKQVLFEMCCDVYNSQVSLTVKLVLDDVVESLKKEEHKMMILGRREQEPAGGEGLQQVE